VNITDVPGVRVGHRHDERALTGCTVVLPPSGTTGAVFVAGGAPGTREAALFADGSLHARVDAVLLTGGSAFGLAAADGVMRWCEERGLGFDTPAARVPIVPAAVLFDLGIGDARVRPTADDGYAACEAASETEAREGSVGAAMGATVGKGAGFAFQSRGGLGVASRAKGNVVVGALAACNAAGDVLDADGSLIAGARAEPSFEPHPAPATTLCVVATNVALDRNALARVARMAAASLARAIWPVHTMFDGDVVFALSTGAVEAHPEAIGVLAGEAVCDAVRRGVRAATSVEGAPAMGRR
jgi:L-aminopeptidase/D-esterase-like protein